MLQFSALDCGAACLTMILSYYGIRARIEDCRQRCGIGRDGTTARIISEAARSFGLVVRSYSLEPEQLSHLPLPGIAHWGFNHFIVVEHWSSSHVRIIDPAVGRRRLTAEEFDEGFTGVLLLFEPAPGVKQSPALPSSPWRSYGTRLLKIAGLPRIASEILLVSAVLELVGLGLPLLMQGFIDDVLPNRLSDVMLILGVGVILLAVFHAFTSYLRATLLLRLQTRLDVQLMPSLVGHLLGLPLTFFQQRSSGDILMRLGSDATIRELLTGQAPAALLDGVMVLAYAAILFVRAPSLGTVAITLGLAQTAIVLLTRQSMRELTQRDLLARAESESYTVELLSGITQLKAGGSEDRALYRWHRLFYDQLKNSLLRAQFVAGVDSMMFGLRVAGPLLLLWFGGLRVLDGSLSLGEMLALTALGTAFLTSLGLFVTALQQVQRVGAQVERLLDLAEARAEQDRQLVRHAPQLRGGIELHSVSFRYAAYAPLVAHDISVLIEPGQKVALVGRTGSGKTTLAMLLLGLYPPTEGEVRYDGVPLNALDYRSVRSQFGIVLQDSFLFSGSIRDNISSFHDEGLEPIVQAARAACMHDEVLSMPMGYDTRVGEKGTALSGGQRQRLALARALVRNPAILLLDESTSQVDALTELAIEHNLKQLGCTRIVIAHRLRTICDADVILVMDGGTIAERGSHDELSASGGLYAKMVSAQVDDSRAGPQRGRGLLRIAPVGAEP
jgi:ABC-type bacteriocin/lantibiotic exporter with double-glycine peptidase domain